MISGFEIMMIRKKKKNENKHKWVQTFPSINARQCAWVKIEGIFYTCHDARNSSEYLKFQNDWSKVE